ncbi:MAG: hypothetical protein H6868_02380 [Rhodospirillales bacterium]|nr:hypothetical protein [Rhodospirillales bacterium]
MTDIDDIKTRNIRVEADKAWETSKTRRALITVGTYIIVGSYLIYLGVENALWHAAVPAGAYLISTQTLPLLRRLWIEHIYRKNSSDI